MIPSSILKSVYNFQFKNNLGSGFFVSTENKQYFITALHVVEGIESGDSVNILHEKKDMCLCVKDCLLGNNLKPENDFAILTFNQPINPECSLSLDTEGLVIGQNVYFLGFPLGFSTTINVTSGQPIPLVKGAIFSGSLGDSITEIKEFLLDGHNNQGFSGGPAIFNAGDNLNPQYKVFGVIKGYKLEEISQNSDSIQKSFTLDNSGIISCTPVINIIEKIKNHPIGCEISN